MKLISSAATEKTNRAAFTIDRLIEHVGNFLPTYGVLEKLTSPWLSTAVFEFSPGDKGVTSM